MKSYRILLALVVITLTGALIPLSAPVLADPPKCKIVNKTTDAVFDNLQAAVDAASSGDTLKLKGSCVGNTVINKDLTIDGHSNPAFGPATLDGNGGNNRVLTISPGSNITLEGLTITGGEDGGGIRNDGTLSLDNSTVSNNSVEDGGGIFSSGTLMLNNSTVSGNWAEEGGGGGIFSSGTLTLNMSTVSNNSAKEIIGGIWNSGELTLINTTVSDNLTYSDGGGIYNSGILNIDDASIISGNVPDDCAPAPYP